MKRNKFIKIACAMLVMCLLTTCVVGTTLAKYITGTSASDTARVAKWGVEVSASGTMFGKAYQDTIVTDGKTSATVQSNNLSSVSKVVAPGTKNDTGIQIAIKGIPEVEFTVVAKQVGDVNDIFLKPGNYGVMVDAYGVNYATDFANEKIYYFDGAEDAYIRATSYVAGTVYYKLTDEATVAGKTYYPIVWNATVWVNGTKFTKTYTTLKEALTEGLIKGINDYDGTVGENGSYNPNTKIDLVYKLTWAWAYKDQNDGADTILGNLMAKEQGSDVKVVRLSGTNYVAVKSAEYSLNVGGGFEVTATQVD